MDDDSFLRKNFNSYHPGLPALFIDNETATNQGYQFAKFRAGEMLQDFLINRIRLLYKAPNNLLLAKIVITITGNSAHGLFNGAQTLLQLIGDYRTLDQQIPGAIELYIYGSFGTSYQGE